MRGNLRKLTIFFLACSAAIHCVAQVDQESGQKRGYHKIVGKAAQAVVFVETDRGSGSGVIISDEGLVLTNQHVIESAKSIYIQTIFRDRYKATLIGGDPGSDIAVLRITALNLPCAKIGDSSNLEPGELVLAIGNPLNNLHSVSSGIVSALGRTDKVSDRLIQNYVQTDAAINRGNSGGGLFDSFGNLIGINTWGISKQISEGLGFAIPINQAMDIAQQIIETGKVSRGRMGIEVKEMTSMDRAGLRVPRSVIGVVVVDVDQEGPAEKAGLRANDLIVELDNESTPHSGVLQAVAGSNPPGKKVKLVYYRGFRKLEVMITLGE